MVFLSLIKLTVNYAMEDMNEIIAAQNAQLVEIKAQMSPNEKIEKKFSDLEAAYERIEPKVIRLEKTNIQLKEDFKEHVSHLFMLICILSFVCICKSINFLSLATNN
jgi:hypothetical protein